MKKELFEPINLSSGVALKNRLVMAPMTTQSAFYDGEITEEIIEYYRCRAGGAAAVIVESCFIEEHGRGFPGALGVDTDKKIAGLTRLAKAIKEKGSKAILQIYHAGRMAWPEYNGGAHPICASPVAALRPNAPVPKEMSDDEILTMIQRFGDATRRAIKAGYDGVEIHGANTFLIQQFFSPHSNRRNDHWGGSLEKRAHFPLAVLEEVQRVRQEEAAEGFIIGYRFSPEEMEKPGICFEETMYLLNQLAKSKPEYLHFSMGTYQRSSIIYTECSEPLIVKFLTMRSPELSTIPIIGVGSILQREDAEAALEIGYDLLAIGKGFLVEPNWVQMIAEKKVVRHFALSHAQSELKIPTPLWQFMEEMVIDPEEEKQKHERLKELQKRKVAYQPGTYLVQAQGHNSPIEMQVTFSKEKIEEIIIDKGNESEGLSDLVFTRIPEQIIEGQTLNVDAVSGASASSQGVIAGVEEAVKLAGADVEVLKARPKPVVAWSEEVVEESVDVVIIGSGAAGISAALRADQLGLKVILLEKLSFVGGAISISGGNQVVTGSKLQQVAGVKDDTPSAMVADFLENGNGLNDQKLLTLFAENIGETTDWVHEYLGVAYDIKQGLHVLAEYQKNRELAYQGGGAGFAQTVRKTLQNSGVQVLLQTKAQQLLVDDLNNVIGVKALEESGKTYMIYASTVIVTTGGYGNNASLLKERFKQILYYGPKSATGDGLLMATIPALKAQTRAMDQGKIYPNGLEVSQGVAKSTIGGNLIVLKENGILVNQLGKRVVNERASNKKVLEALLKQTPPILYLLLDGKHFEHFSQGVAEGGITSEELACWIAQEEKATPRILKAATLEQLAIKAQMPVEQLIETVDNFNYWVAQGRDEEFHRAPEYLQEPIGAGPYYLIEQKPRFATTLGGLAVNRSLQVLNQQNQPIKGLYAAGEVVGGVMGSDSPSGANNAWALTSGKLAAEAVWEVTKGPKKA
ncbi:FAD-dependent oxidoreductase [Enterococcus casseliflavus]|uniref:NADH-dependent flavin oxidoreductase n=1 Tax=Enterococcus casseliflavus TaxID=37734 RepID=UPI0014331006|nr:NADH-dependent flavin oxidoreductase [Enterococcus casseliflavus]NKD36823.1 FAD-dependent oxidoreductase [Enterococcus casseliflavus]